MESFFDFLLQLADIKIDQINKKGFVAAGHNGPYYDEETPIRNSAHWIIIFSYLLKKTEEKKYLDAIQKLAEYLYEDRTKAGVEAFYCRDKKGKDHVNGTIGQAWAIEGLVKASEILDDDKYYDLAVKVFKQHRFSKRYNVWNRIEVDGTELGFDNTYNHQLWLAAAGAEIIGYRNEKQIREEIASFLSASEKTALFNVSRNGVVKHFAYIPDTMRHKMEYFKRELLDTAHHILHKPSMQYKEEGYHYFNMYGFAILKQSFSGHSFFSSKKFQRALRYTPDFNNLNVLETRDPKSDVTQLATKFNSACNIYSYGYNSPAFELPFIVNTFCPEWDNEGCFSKMWNLQLKYTMADKEHPLSKNTGDVETLCARTYELIRVVE